MLLAGTQKTFYNLCFTASGVAAKDFLNVDVHQCHGTQGRTIHRAVASDVNVWYTTVRSVSTTADDLALLIWRFEAISALGTIAPSA